MKQDRTVIAVDLAKTVFEIAVSHTPGDVAGTKRLSRAAFLAFFRDQAPAIVAMEACGSAHYWARELLVLGHTVELIPPHLVRPYVTRNKTDRADAKGILEARRNTEIRSVPVKTLAQQVIGSIHPFRSGWIGARTAQVHILRGLLREIGLVIPVGVDKVVPTVRSLVEERAVCPWGMPTRPSPAASGPCSLLPATRSSRLTLASSRPSGNSKPSPMPAPSWHASDRSPASASSPEPVDGVAPTLAKQFAAMLGQMAKKVHPFHATGTAKSSLRT